MAIRQRDLEVLVNREVVEQMVLLKHETDLLVPERGAFFRLQMMNGRCGQRIFPPPAGVMHPEDWQQARFSRARWPHNRNEFAFGDVQIDIAQDVEKLLLA